MDKKKPDPLKQQTIHGHEIPIPPRRDFLRDLKKIAKPKALGPPRRASKQRPK